MRENNTKVVEQKTRAIVVSSTFWKRAVNNENYQTFLVKLYPETKSDCDSKSFSKTMFAAFPFLR